MKYNKTLALIPAILLAACGGGDKQTIDEKPRPGAISTAGKVSHDVL